MKWGSVVNLLKLLLLLPSLNILHTTTRTASLFPKEIVETTACRNLNCGKNVAAVKNFRSMYGRFLLRFAVSVVVRVNIAKITIRKHCITFSHAQNCYHL